MRRHIKRTVNRIAALIGVGALSIVLFDAGSWAVVLASWFAAWAMLQLIGHSIATALEKRLPAPPYHLLVRPVDMAVRTSDLAGINVGGVRFNDRIPLSRESSGDPAILKTGKRRMAG